MLAPAVAFCLSLASAVTFTDSRTDQGMRVLLAPDASAPQVAVSLTYDFGSRNEHPGQTGVANLLHTLLLRDLQRRCKEKLLIPDAEKDEACRGSNNQERTSYTLTVPADRLEPALSLLAGQMRAANTDLDGVRAGILEQRQKEDAYARAVADLAEGMSESRGPSLFRIRLNLESDYWKQVLATPRGRAETLSRFSIYYHDSELINGELKAILGMTAADVQRVARKYLNRDNRAVVLTLHPK